MAQTGNYVKNTVYKIPTAVSIANPTITQAAVQITYLDGLGRPIQQRAYMQSNTGKDIVTHMEYDNLGRQIKEYLPYPSSSPSLNYDPGAKALLMSYYASTNVPATAYPYSEKKLEESPFNRVLAQYAPGETWANPFGTANTDHGVRFDYLTNATNEVRLFKASAGTTKGNYNISLINTGTYYAERELSKTVTKNENWTSGVDNTTEEFKDKEGRVVLKRVYGASIAKSGTLPTNTTHDTYYVYDQYSNLTFVLPPVVNTAAAISTTILNDLCYQYKYDYRNRLVEKKLPGTTAWEYIVYDKLNRIVATGPANSPFTDLAGIGWMITKYDIFNRPVLTGWMSASAGTIASADRKVLQDARDLVTSNFSETKTTSITDTNINSVLFRYSNVALPTAGYHVLTVNYYDDYNFKDMPAIPATVEGQTVFYNTTQKPKGLATGSWVRTLQTSTAIDGALTYTLYDKKARVLQAKTNNYLTGYSQVDSKMDDFSGRLIYTMTRHKRTAGGNEMVSKDSFTYTDQGRVLKHSKQIGTDPEQMLSKNEYNELGQLVSKRVGSYPATPTETGLQKIDYTYTIRGWLSGINKTEDGSNFPLKQGTDPDDLFAFRLAYDNPATAQPLYNGNISEAFWRTSSDNIIRKYAYQYDVMNRMTGATYQKPGTITNTTHGSYDESATYDKNGNIQSLSRYGEYDDNVVSLETDHLTYSYDSAQRNKLLAVTDSTFNPNGFSDGNATGNDYAYDDYGNMVKDLNKGIGTATTNGITYNHLRLPVKITFAGGNTIEYLYNATGQKLQKKVTEGAVISTTDYIDGFVYFNTTLKFFPTSEGYVNNTVVNGNNVYNYVYNYTDHLGNVRLSYGLDPSTNVLKILEENNYYPFGLKHKNYNMSEKYYTKNGGGVVISPPCEGCPRTYKYDYKYNGQEWQGELGLNMYSMNMRNYDPAIGRWIVQDPVVHHDFSPYNAFDNNPIYWADPSGADGEHYNWDTGHYENSTGNQVSWNQVQQEYGIGSYAYNTGVMLAPEYDNNGRIKNDYGTGALENIVNSAMRSGGNLTILHVRDADDAASQMEGITANITNLFILSHGDSKSEPGHRAYFAIGNKNYNNVMEINKSEALSRIATVLATKRGIFTSGYGAEVLLFACGAGGTYNGGIELISSLATKLNAIVFGNQSLTRASASAFQGSSLSFTHANWPAGHDQNGAYSSAYNNAGNWSMATPNGNVSTVHNVQLDGLGNIHYN